MLSLVTRCCGIGFCCTMLCLFAVGLSSVSDLCWLVIVGLSVRSVVALFVFVFPVCFCCVWKVLRLLVRLQKISWVWSVVVGVWVSIADDAVVLWVEVAPFGGVVIADVVGAVVVVGQVLMLVVAVFRLLESILLRGVQM